MTQYEFNKAIAEALQSLALEVSRLYDGEISAYDLSATREKIDHLVMFLPGDEDQYE